MVMATVKVVAINRNRVLIGKSGVWATQGLPDAVANQIRDMQRSNLPNEEDAFNQVKRRIAQVTALLPGDETVNLRREPVRRPTQQDPTFSFRFYKSRENPGVIKGEIELGEDPRVAAAREFREETGFRLPNPDLLIDLGANTFVIVVPNLTANAIIRTWEEMVERREGELTELNWEAITPGRLAQLNQQSREAIEFARASGVQIGGKRRSTRGRRALRKTRKAYI
jgi:8-oxo-dGTP pyrophosphatase MutT (NUDIX family)